MMGMINCDYETPCGWCSKFDRECDKKVSNDDILKTIDVIKTKDKVLEDIKNGKGLSQINSSIYTTNEVVICKND